jgi:hypothetical protein
LLSVPASKEELTGLAADMYLRYFECAVLTADVRARGGEHSAPGSDL